MCKSDLLDELVMRGNGYLKTSDVIENGISKPYLSSYVLKNQMERVAHGVYISKEVIPDVFLILSLRNSRIVFSLETSMYLNGMIDREPSVITVTVPEGYNDAHLRNQGIRVVHTSEKLFSVGIASIETFQGNTVPVYDRERTICDLLRHKKDIDPQMFRTAMKEYMGSNKKNLFNLMNYARVFGVEEEVRLCTEVML